MASRHPPINKAVTGCVLNSDRPEGEKKKKPLYILLSTCVTYFPYLPSRAKKRCQRRLPDFSFFYAIDIKTRTVLCMRKYENQDSGSH